MPECSQANNSEPAAERSRAIVNRVIAIYSLYGERRCIGDPLSTLENALQAAASARDAGQKNAVVAATLLHKIGYLLWVMDQPGIPEPIGDDCTFLEFEFWGAGYLHYFSFPATTVNLVGEQFNAVRYHTWKDPDYSAGLSES